MTLLPFNKDFKIKIYTYEGQTENKRWESQLKTPQKNPQAVLRWCFAWLGRDSFLFLDSKLLFSGTILYHCEIQFCILSPNIYQTEGIWHKMRSRCSWCGVACVFSASVEVFSFRLVQFLAFLDYLSISIITHTHTHSISPSDSVCQWGVRHSKLFESCYP